MKQTIRQQVGPNSFNVYEIEHVNRAGKFSDAIRYTLKDDQDGFVYVTYCEYDNTINNVSSINELEAWAEEMLFVDCVEQPPTLGDTLTTSSYDENDNDIALKFKVVGISEITTIEQIRG